MKLIFSMVCFFIGSILIANEDTNFKIENSGGEQVMVEDILTKPYLFLAYSTPT